MVDKQQFIKGTDYIKHRYNLTSEQVGERIGGNKNTIDNPRRGSSKPNFGVVQKLIAEWPDSEPYFLSNDAQNNIVNDSQEQVGYGEMGILKETLSVQKELIAMQRLRIAQLEIENERLKNPKGN